MSIDSQIISQIDTIVTSNDLYTFLLHKSKFIYPYLGKLLSKIKSMKDGLSYNQKILDLLFFNRPQIVGWEYFILREYLNSINYYMIPITSITKLQRDLYFLMIDENKIEEWCKWPNSSNVEDDDNARNEASIMLKDWQKEFILTVFDMYIPTDTIEDDLSELINSDCNLLDIIKGNYPKVSSLYAMKAAKYIADIYAHDECKSDAFVEFHELVRITYNFIDDIDRYAKIFANSKFGNIYGENSKEEFISLMYKFFMLFSDIDNTTENNIGAIADAIEEFNKYYKVVTEIKNITYDPRVIKIILSKCLDIASDLIDVYHYDQYKTIIDNFESHINKENINSQITKESTLYTPQDCFEYVAEEYKKNSVNIHETRSKFYKAYKNYKNNADKVDSQVDKAIQWVKRMITGDVKSEVIEGKKFSPMKILKNVLATAAIFSVAPVAGLIAVVTRHALRKSTTVSERKKIAMELEAEIEMINEKIDDARGDGDREAKYAMMRTRTELQNALKKIKYGMEADNRSVATAKSTIADIRGGR